MSIVTFDNKPTSYSAAVSDHLHIDDLSFDVINYVISHIDTHRDLISLALTSRKYTELVIPRHSEYRIIRMRVRRPTIWAHLAQRPDLAAQIRSVCMDHPYVFKERFPTSLVDGWAADVGRGPAHDANGEDQYFRNKSCAIQNMERLQEFEFHKPKNASRQGIFRAAAGVFQALVECKSLLNLKINGNPMTGLAGFCDFSNSAEKSSKDVADYPLFNIRNLHSIDINGFVWSSAIYEPSVMRLLSLSPHLNCLRLHFDTTNLPMETLHFPQLHTLSLVGTFHQSLLRFLKTHSNIEDAELHFREDAALTPGSLPKLKRLTAGSELITSILLDTTIPPRPIEFISGISLDRSSLRGLASMATSKIEEVSVVGYDDLQSIHSLAEVCPNIDILHITNIRGANSTATEVDYPLDDYIQALSYFPHLRVLKDYSVWRDIQGLDPKLIEQTVQSLVRLCGKLEWIEYSHHDTPMEKSRIVFLRTLDNVAWEEVTLPMY